MFKIFSRVKELEARLTRIEDALFNVIKMVDPKTAAMAEKVASALYKAEIEMDSIDTEDLVVKPQRKGNIGILTCDDCQKNCKGTRGLAIHQANCKG